jgi:HAD superfamily hydrolase (TIGR01509 family)
VATTKKRNKKKMKVNILIPMAGEGSRFRSKGFHRSKPFIDVAGKPMIEWVLDNVSSSLVDAQWIFVIRQEHDPNGVMTNQLKTLRPNAIIVHVATLTEGSACTTLLARGLIDSSTPLLIVNSDQYLEWDVDAFWTCVIREAQSDGNIVCFHHPRHLNDTKWSYASTDSEGVVLDVQEKKVISENATVGIYYWTRGSDYVAMTDHMIRQDIRVNNEFYVAPVYNQGIARGMKFHLSFCRKMHGLGIPADLTAFLHEKVQPERSQRPVRWIAHRGNRMGSNPARENHPDYIREVLSEGFDVEVDVWWMNGEWFLGHDAPQYRVDASFIDQDCLWIHCKNGAALAQLASKKHLNCFFHHTDDYTLTSQGFVWAYPGKTIHHERTVAVMYPNPLKLLSGAVVPYGICADDVALLSQSMKSRFKVVVFDLDGVLVESKELHYRAFNAAVTEAVGSGYALSEAEHTLVYDGLSTRQKLRLMQTHKQLPAASVETIFHRKQELTSQMIQNQIRPDPQIINTLQQLKQMGYPIAVASNCIRQSVREFLTALELWNHVDALFSNEDVAEPKPDPAIYSKVADSFGVNTTDLFVVEDSPKGFEAVVRSGAHLHQVKSPADVRFPSLMAAMNMSDCQVQIVVPLARPGATYWLDGPNELPTDLPLQLLDMDGQVLLKRMCDNIRPPNTRCRWIFLVPRSDQQHRWHSLLPNITGYEDTVVIPVVKEQLGAMNTVLLAESHLSHDVPLMVFDGSHIVEWYTTTPPEVLLDALKEVDALVTIHEDSDPRWSYVETSGQRVLVVREKKPISCRACTGLYIWKRPKDFIQAARRLQQKQTYCRGQYYISQVMQECLETVGFHLRSYMVKRSWSLRTMDEVSLFRRSMMPIIAHQELEEIYREMKARNRTMIEETGLRWDPLLGIRDERLCHAIYVFCEPTNWSPTVSYLALMQRLIEMVPRHVFGLLHFTLMQLVGFEVFDQVKLPADYYQVIQSFLVNHMVCFECHFDRVCLTPKSIMLQGVPSIHVNHARNLLRRELKRLGYPLLEPYKSDMIHMTLVRFCEPLDLGDLEKVAERFSGVDLGTLRVTHFDMGPASWDMIDTVPVLRAELPMLR